MKLSKCIKLNNQKYPKTECCSQRKRTAYIAIKGKLWLFVIRNAWIYGRFLCHCKIITVCLYASHAKFTIILLSLLHRMYNNIVTVSWILHSHSYNCFCISYACNIIIYHRWHVLTCCRWALIIPSGTTYEIWQVVCCMSAGKVFIYYGMWKVM